MALTPMDIYNKEFSKRFRGYDEEEVDMFLDQVVDEYEKLEKANAAANEKIESLNEQLQHYRSLEDTLKETLMTAQNTAEEVVENARKRAELIIESAQREARDIVERANSQIEEAEKMHMELRRSAAVFKSRFVALLEAQLEFFRQETPDIHAERGDGAEVASQPEAWKVSAETPEQPQEQPADVEPEPEPEPIEPIYAQEPEELIVPVQEPESAAPEEAAPAPQNWQNEQAPEPEAAEPPAPAQEDAEPNDIDYFGAVQPPAEPLDTGEEDIADDADALIREIQHYSALRSDEDTVSDEGFIIGNFD